uniref:Uncharacterized protein n=1 Tax=Tetradesmus obliquus TaxID=3088 RepID=A0A383WQF8_TETOB|eukprot:jgi/Sobl393_1/8976/SZX79386.1
MQLAEAVVDAFVWPLRLLGLGPDEEQQHLPLLSVPHNALVNHTIPALTAKEKANLGLSCNVLSQLVASTFTNVTRLELTVRGWHDVGTGAPQLLLQLSRALPKVQEVLLLDRSHEDVYEPLHTPTAGGMAQQVGSMLWQAAASAATATGMAGSSGAEMEPGVCEGCGSSSELPDSTGVLVSLLALYPGLRKLEVYTKLFSVAEVSALSRLPQLTSLTLNSEDGVEPGALCALSQLATLQELKLGDVDGNNPDDVDTVCNMVTRLTSLHMGYCPRLQPPVLRKLLQVHNAMQQYLHEQQQQAQQQQRWEEFQAAGLAGKTARTAQYAASAAGSAAASVLGMAGSSVLSAVPGLGSSSSSRGGGEGSWGDVDQAPAGPHLRKSEQMLLEAGVPYEVLSNEDGTPTSSAAMAAAAAAAPKPEGYTTYEQQEQQQRGSQLNTAAVDARAAERAGAGPNGAAAVAASQAAGDTPVTAASFSLPGDNSKPSPGPSFRLVTELSVCIDAEEGQDILYEMSQLALLQSLLVDSTDEFRWGGWQQQQQQQQQQQRATAAAAPAAGAVAGSRRCTNLPAGRVCVSAVVALLLRA